MEIILIIFSFFVARFFYFLSKKFKRNIFLYTFIGLLFFLLVYVFSTLFSVMLFSLLLKSSSFVNEIIINCFTTPFALLISAIHYKITENRFKKDVKKNNVNDIGR